MFPPVAIGQARIVSADLSVGSSLHLPTGTCAIIPHHAMHCSSLNWDKPNEFLPGEQQAEGAGHCCSFTGLCLTRNVACSENSSSFQSISCCVLQSGGWCQARSMQWPGRR